MTGAATGRRTGTARSAPRSISACEALTSWLGDRKIEMP